MAHPPIPNNQPVYTLDVYPIAMNTDSGASWNWYTYFSTVYSTQGDQGIGNVMSHMDGLAVLGNCGISAMNTLSELAPI